MKPQFYLTIPCRFNNDEMTQAFASALVFAKAIGHTVQSQSNWNDGVTYTLVPDPLVTVTITPVV